MKAGRAILMCLFAFVHSHLCATVYNLNQASGTISKDQYTNDMHDEWNINIGSDKLIKFSYSIDTEESYDHIFIYNVDNSGTATLLKRAIRSSIRNNIHDHPQWKSKNCVLVRLQC